MGSKGPISKPCKGAVVHYSHQLKRGKQNVTALLVVLALVLVAIMLAFPQAKIPSKIMTVLSEGIPMVAFLVVFITFMATIVSRYVFRIAIPWSFEVSILGYMYCMFFGSGIALTRDEHVVFSLLYDKLSPMGKMISKLLYNAVMIVLICIAFKPCVNSILGMSQATGILKMPYKYIFAPFLWMLLECVVRALLCMVTAVKEFKASKNELAEGKEAQA